jgi:hypothetical protein
MNCLCIHFSAVSVSGRTVVDGNSADLASCVHVRSGTSLLLVFGGFMPQYLVRHNSAAGVVQQQVVGRLVVHRCTAAMPLSLTVRYNLLFFEPYTLTPLSV